MVEITITEALAETKTIAKRIENKQQFILLYLFREERIKDPLIKEGGAEKVIGQEMQSIADLNERKVAIRRQIQDANANYSITVGKETRSIADWLVWRREVASNMKTFYMELRKKIEVARTVARSRGSTISSGEGSRPDDIVVNLNEQTISQKIETLEETLGVLDGMLSLKNATIRIAV